MQVQLIENNHAAGDDDAQIVRPGRILGILLKTSLILKYLGEGFIGSWLGSVYMGRCCFGRLVAEM